MLILIFYFFFKKFFLCIGSAQMKILKILCIYIFKGILKINGEYLLCCLAKADNVVLGAARNPSLKD